MKKNCKECKNCVIKKMYYEDGYATCCGCEDKLMAAIANLSTAELLARIKSNEMCEFYEKGTPTIGRGVTYDD